MAFVISGSTIFGASLRLNQATSSCRVVRASATDATTSPRIDRRSVLAVALAAGVSVFLPTSPARADHTYTAAKLSFERYFPRIQSGLNDFREIRAAVKDGNLAKANDLASQKTFDIKLKRALTIYATSFSDSSVNRQSKELLACVDGIYGNISKSVSAPTQEVAVLAFNQAAQAFQAYIRVARLTNKLSASDLQI